MDGTVSSFGLNKYRQMTLFGDYIAKLVLHNIKVMIVRNFMADLLRYTKKISQRIKYYDAIIDFTDESHWFNPFYQNKSDIVVIWTDEPEEDVNY